MRSYKAARRAAQRAEDGALDAVPFEVSYFDSAGDEHTDVFSCTGEVSTATATDLAYHSDLAIESVEGVAMLRRVFEEAIGDVDEFRRFWRIAPRIDDDVLVQIMSDLLEDTTGRPTRQSSSSPTPPSADGDGSRSATPLPEGVIALPNGTLFHAPPDEPETESYQAQPTPVGQTGPRHMSAVEQMASSG